MIYLFIMDFNFFLETIIYYYILYLSTIMIRHVITLAQTLHRRFWSLLAQPEDNNDDVSPIVDAVTGTT